MKMEIQYFYFKKKNNVHLSICFVKVKARLQTLHHFLCVFLEVEYNSLGFPSLRYLRPYLVWSLKGISHSKYYFQIILQRTFKFNVLIRKAMINVLSLVKIQKAKE